MRGIGTVLLAMLIFLAGCASIPLSTALRLSTLEPRELAQVDPAQVRVRVSVPADYELNIPASRLTLTLALGPEKRHVEMGLSSLQQTLEHRSAGLFAGDIAVSTYVLALTPTGAQQLRSVQQFILAKDPDEFAFGVSAPLAKTPANAREITFWADVKLSASDPYMPLIDAAKIKFSSAGAGS